MESVGLEMVFEDTFGLTEVNFSGSEKLDKIGSAWFIMNLSHQF